MNPPVAAIALAPGEPSTLERADDFQRTLRDHTRRLDAELAGVRSLLEAETEWIARTTDLLRRYERDHRAIIGRLADLEQQKTEFANLFVACYRLHSTLDRGEVLNAIQEIVANLVGSEELVVFEVDSTGDALVPIWSFGVPRERFSRVVANQGRLGSLLRIADLDIEPPSPTADGAEAQLSAAIPLCADGRLVGALAIFRLLEQKPGYESLDRELLELLSQQAGVALRASGLAEREQRGWS